MTLGAFQLDVVSQVAIAKDYFSKEGLELCTAQVFTSLAGYTNLGNGSYDVLNAAVDNLLFRRFNMDPPQVFSVAGGSDMGVGYVVLADQDTLETLDGKTYASDGPQSGFITFAYEMARLSGVDPTTLLNVSGFNNDQRNSLANGETVNGQTADWVFQSLLYGIPEFYEDQWENLNEIGRMKDYIWPIQGSAYTVKPDYQDNPANLEKLKRFFKAMIRAYQFSVKKSNRRKVIKIIEDSMNQPENIAEEIYEISITAIQDLAGVNPFVAPSRRGIFNNVALRYNLNMGPPPSEIDLEAGPGNVVDLRALDLAFDDMNIGSAYECYDSFLMQCED